MGQEQIQRQPQKKRSSDQQSIDTRTPSGQPVYIRPPNSSSYDAGTDDIDKLLAENQGFADRSSQAQAKNQEALDSLHSGEDGFTPPAAPVQSGAPSLFKPEISRPAAAGGALAAGALKDGEATGSGAAGLYKAAGSSEADSGGSFKGKLAGISRRRKLLASGGVGGISGLIIAMLLITPLYRIPALMSDLEHEVGKEVDHIVEKRAERIVVRYLINKVGGDATNYVITGSPLSDIWRTFRSRQVEKQLADQTGITFKKIGNVVHVFQDGRDLGDGRKVDAVMKILDRGTIESRKDFKQITKLVVNFHRATKEAKSFDLRFLKGRGYRVPEEDPADKAAEQAGTETAQQVAEKDVEKLTQQQIEEGTAGSVGEIGDALTCIIDGTACDTFKADDPAAPASTASADVAAHDAGTGASKQVTGDINQAASETEAEVIKDRSKSFFSTLLEKILLKVLGPVVGKVAVSSIPYIGWIDLAATLQHAIGNFFANDLAHAIPVLLKENAYGAIYAAWLGFGDQTKAGKVPLPMLAALSKQAAGTTDGAEQAATYKYQQGSGTNAGVPVNPKVGSNTYSEANNIINEVYNNLGYRIVIRGPLEVWYYTIGKLLNSSFSWIIKGIAWIFGQVGINGAFGSILKSIFGPNWQKEFGTFAVKFILNLLGVAVDPLATGSALYNNLFTGGSVALNYHCHNILGCRTLTQQQGAIINMQLQQEEDRTMAMTPLKDRLFSVNTPNSLVNKLVRAAPGDMKPGTIMASLFSQVAKLPSSILSAFSPKIRAAELDDLSLMTGVQWYGATEQDLSADIDPTLRTQPTGTTCPQTDPTKQFNTCLADKAVMDTLQCEFSGPCPEFNDAAGTTPGGGTVTPGGCGGSGKYSALVSASASFAGIDQGIDFVPAGNNGFDICAPAPGTITLADQTGHSFQRTSGTAEIIEKLDQPPNAPSSSQFIYFAEIIQINSAIHVGVHVDKSGLIGHSGQSPGIEVGWAPSATRGFMCGIGGVTACGNSFNTWVQGR